MYKPTHLRWMNMPTLPESCNSVWMKNKTVLVVKNVLVVKKKENCEQHYISV